MDAEIGDDDVTFPWIDRSDDYRGGYALGYEAGKKRAGENIQNADLRVAEERERCVQLFLAYAFDAHGWKLKDGEADGVRMMLEDLRSGAEVFEPFVFLESDPSNHGMPSIRLAKEVRALPERPEPTTGEPSAEPESE